MTFRCLSDFPTFHGPLAKSSIIPQQPRASSRFDSLEKYATYAYPPLCLLYLYLPLSTALVPLCLVPLALSPTSSGSRVQPTTLPHHPQPTNSPPSTYLIDAINERGNIHNYDPIPPNHHSLHTLHARIFPQPSQYCGTKEEFLRFSALAVLFFESLAS